jgi:uncharacterized protein
MKLTYSTNDVEELFDDPLVIEVTQTASFRRLREISFLGAIDKSLGNRGAQSRYDHSLGVAVLAQHYGRVMGFSSGVQRKITLAALLHDIGHPPLSHTLEPLFIKQFGLDHHIATKQLLFGQVNAGKALSSLLQRNHVDAAELIDLISGNNETPAGQIFSSPINVDTIEAIWRGRAYFSASKTFSPIELLNSFIALSKSCLSSLDSFWEHKDHFYQLVVYSTLGLSTDHMARRIVEQSCKTLQPSDFYVGEKSFLKKFWRDADSTESGEIQANFRRFTVDRTSEATTQCDFVNRYKTHRYKKTVHLTQPSCLRRATPSRSENMALEIA